MARLLVQFDFKKADALAGTVVKDFSGNGNNGFANDITVEEGTARFKKDTSRIELSNKLIPLGKPYTVVFRCSLPANVYNGEAYMITTCGGYLSDPGMVLRLYEAPHSAYSQFSDADTSKPKSEYGFYPRANIIKIDKKPIEPPEITERQYHLFLTHENVRNKYVTLFDKVSGVEVKTPITFVTNTHGDSLIINNTKYRAQANKAIKLELFEIYDGILNYKNTSLIMDSSGKIYTVSMNGNLEIVGDSNSDIFTLLNLHGRDLSEINKALSTVKNENYKILTLQRG